MHTYFSFTSHNNKLNIFYDYACMVRSRYFTLALLYNKVIVLKKNEMYRKIFVFIQQCRQKRNSWNDVL